MKWFASLAAVSLFCMSLIGAESRPPEGVVGRWVAGTASATTYWERGTGRFLGNGSGSGQVYEFDKDGNFTYHMLLEVRTGAFVSRVLTNCKGKVTFDGDSFTLHPESGHYHSEIGSSVTDRDMTEEDLKRQTKTNKWTLTKGADGKPRFVVPFEDGSKFEFSPLPDAATRPAEKKK